MLANQGPASETGILFKPYPLGPSNQKEKPRDRPLSVPSQAAIQAIMSAEPQLKARQPHPQSPRQAQKPQSGSNPASIPVVKLVSPRPRGRSHSPYCRIDVAIEEEYQGGWVKGMRSAISHESLMVPSDCQGILFDTTNLLSQSFPVNALHSALSRQKRSYSPVCSSGNFLQVPDDNHLHFPSLDKNKRGSNMVRSSNSICGLGASAPADILTQSLAEVGKMRSQSAHCLLSSSPTPPTARLGLSPQTCTQISPPCSPMSSGSISNLSPLFSPDNFVPNMSWEPSSSIHTHVRSPHQTLIPLRLSRECSPRRSPHGSPFGSQTCIRVGIES